MQSKEELYICSVKPDGFISIASPEFFLLITFTFHSFHLCPDKQAL